MNTEGTCIVQFAHTLLNLKWWQKADPCLSNLANAARAATPLRMQATFYESTTRHKVFHKSNIQARPVRQIPQYCLTGLTPVPSYS